MSARSEAIEIASEALAAEGARWRGWGTITVVRKVIKALEQAGYEVRQSDGVE